jgi:hypothetical protein
MKTNGFSQSVAAAGDRKPVGGRTHAQRALWLCVPLLCLLAGCASMNSAAMQSAQDDGNDDSAVTAAPAAAPDSSFQNNGPQLVLPVTGGVPVTALPLGGDLYLPVTGGPPVVGTSLAP